jgi:hypothetical protein
VCGLRWAVPMKRPVVSGTFPFPCARPVIIADGITSEKALRPKCHVV